MYLRGAWLPGPGHSLAAVTPPPRRAHGPAGPQPSAPASPHAPRHGRTRGAVAARARRHASGRPPGAGRITAGRGLTLRAARDGPVAAATHRLARGGTGARLPPVAVEHAVGDRRWRGRRLAARAGRVGAGAPGPHQGERAHPRVPRGAPAEARPARARAVRGGPARHRQDFARSRDGACAAPAVRARERVGHVGRRRAGGRAALHARSTARSCARCGPRACAIRCC